MARPKRTAAPMLVTPLAQHEDADPTAPTAQAADVMERLGDEGERKVSARIFRIDPIQNTEAFLDRVDPSLIDEPWIRDTYGGGRYFVRFWGPMESGSYGYLKKKTREFTIDSSIEFKGALKERHNGASGPIHNSDGTPAGGVMSGTSMDDIMKAGVLGLLNSMQSASKAQSEAFTLLLSAANKQPEVKPVDWAQVLPGLASVIASLAGIFGSKQDPMQVATQIAALVKDNSGPKGGVNELRDTLGAIAEMRELMGNGSNADRDGDDGGPLLRMLEKSMPGLIDILKTESAKTGIPVPQLVRRPVGSFPPPLPSSAPPAPAIAAGATSPPPASSPAAPTAAQPTMHDEWTPLEPYIPYLVSFASENRDPYGVVQTVKTIAPGSVMANIRELVAKSDALPIVLNRFPAMQAHQAWVALLLDEFYDDAFGPDDDEEEPNEVTPPAAQSPTGEPAT